MDKKELKTFWNRLFGYRAGVRVRVRKKEDEPFYHYKDKLERGLRTGMLIQKICYTNKVWYWLVRLDDNSLGGWKETNLEIL